MARPCSICSHDQSKSINRALVRGAESEREIASRFDVTQAAVDRHRRNHLRPYLAELMREDKELANLDPLAEIKALYFRVRRLLDLAEDAQDWPAIKAFHSEARKDLELLARIVGDINEAQISINVHPQVVEFRTLILNAIKPFPEARAAVSEVLEQKALEEQRSNGNGLL